METASIFLAIVLAVGLTAAALLLFVALGVWKVIAEQQRHARATEQALAEIRNRLAGDAA